MSQSEEASLEAAYDKAAEIAERHLTSALGETGVPDYLIAVMMIEAAVNAAVDLTSAEDILKLLQDLTEQIAADAAEGE